MGYELISFCKANQVAIVNGRVGDDEGIGNLTCKNASVVDYVIISHVLFNYVVNFKVHPFNELFSDCHNAISIEFELEKHAGEVIREPEWESKKDDITSKIGKDQEYVRWDSCLKDNFVSVLNDDDISMLNDKLNNFNHTGENTTQEDMDNLVNDFNVIFLQSARKLNMVKKKGGNKHSKKTRKNVWYDSSCKLKRKAFYRARKKSLNNKDNIFLKQEAKIACKNYKNEVRKCKRNFELRVANEIRHLKVNDPKAYWDKLNSDKHCNKSLIGKPTCQEFFNMFKSIAEENEHELNNLHNLQGEGEVVTDGSRSSDTFNSNYVNNILNCSITEEEVHSAINRLKNNKAHGSDLIINEFLVNASCKMLFIFVKLFNIVLDTGIIPSDWCVGMIKPLFKNKGSPKDPSNYRAITILSCFGKLFTSILNKRISDFIENNQILGCEQAGFRKNHSTADHIFTLYGIIDTLLSKKLRLYCAFLDYEKAFDKVDRIFLWQKLLEQNIDGKVLRVIQNIYTGAKSCVMVDNIASDFFNVKLGVRQGENLSPVLFALFLNDMKDLLSDGGSGLKTLINESLACNLPDTDISNILKLSILLYADDTVIFSESPIGLQSGLDKIKLYCDKWKLKLNANKCKIVVFSRGKVRKFPNFRIGEEQIEVVCNMSYLGLKLNYNNRMSVAHKDLYDRASRAMFALLKKCNSQNLPIDIILDLFEKTIVPILTYGCEVWGFEQLDILQKLQLKFYKIVLKMRTSTPSLIVFGEAGHYPLCVTIKVRMLCFWFKLVSDQNKNKLSTTIYKLLCASSNNGTYENSYIKHIRSCLIQVGMPHLWVSQNVSNIKFSSFKSYIKQCFQDLYIQQWYSQMDNDSIYVNYKILKSTFQQNHIFKLLPNDCSISLVRFFSTNNRLPVNVLRFEGIPRHERLCNNCNMKDVGDEFHYLFTCPYYHTKRTELLPKYYYKYPNVIKYNELLNTTERNLLLKLKHFICFINNSL